MAEKLEDRIRRIVEENDDIRQQVKEAVASASARASDTAERLVNIVRSTMEGAAEGADPESEEDPGRPLRDAIDGLGEGFQRTAQAMRLAVEEAAKNGKAYAEDDLKGMAEELAALREMFADAVQRGAASASKHSSQVLNDLKAHAEKTVETMDPVIQDAVKAARADPAEFARGAADVSATRAREAAGKLFDSIGDLFKGAADKMGERDRES